MSLLGMIQSSCILYFANETISAAAYPASYQRADVIWLHPIWIHARSEPREACGTGCESPAKATSYGHRKYQSLPAAADPRSFDPRPARGQSIQDERCSGASGTR